MQSLLRGSNDAVLVPQPGAPLYAASVSLHGGTPVAYRLDGKCPLWSLFVRLYCDSVTLCLGVV